MIRKFCGLAMLTLLMAATPLRPAQAAVTLIANADVPAAPLSRSTARAIFSMRTVQWPNGRSIRVFVLADSQAGHRALCKELLDIYPYQLKDAWDRQIYTGIGQAPTEVATEEEMRARVAATSGAIGYLSTNTPVSGKAGEHEKLPILIVR